VPIGISRVAALYDIHGNLTALDAVLAHIVEEPVDAVVIGGDIVWGPMPAETLAAVRRLELPVFVIRGNADREVVEGVAKRKPTAEEELTRWCRKQLSAEDLHFLSSLPASVTLDVEGLGPTLFCHGSPRSDEEPITARTSDRALTAMLAGVSEWVVVCGHTHAQFRRAHENHSIVNAGSVGLPFGEPGAYWALLGPNVDLRCTPYDFDAAGAAFRAKGGPLAADFADHALRPPPASTAADLFTSEDA
jgi:predicted phosphodiesterase